MTEADSARAYTGTHARFRPTTVTSGTPLQLVRRRRTEIVPPQPSDPARSRWLVRYRLGLVAIDLVAVVAALGLSYLVRFGPPSGTTPHNGPLIAVLPALWLLLVAASRGYDARFVGVGATEFERVFRAFLHMIALVALVAFVTRVELSRGFALVALPLTLVLDLGGRYAARKWLHNQRAAGRAMRSVVIVGDATAVTGFTAVLRRDRYAGMRVVGACVPTELAVDRATHESLRAAGIPLLGDVDSVVSAVRHSGADTVAVVSSGAVGPDKLRWISWQLEGSDTDLVVSPGLIEVAGPRLHIQPVAGLPLLHVEEPEFTGFRRVLKGGFDRTVAAAALFALAPILFGLVLAVRGTSSGPAFFRQVRVGRNGDTFTMLKFRSMYVDAEDRLAAIHAQNDHGEGVLFKMRSDPRITSVGRLLRKFSLDELPQLINVVNGSMSLVGPRPPLPSEVARYEEHVHRRFLVKPGLTGLWQVSGRSDLAWDESVRLDLRYVENWSIGGDLQILWKTLFTVVRGTGAY